jgi:hypothetical protein
MQKPTFVSGPVWLRQTKFRLDHHLCARPRASVEHGRVDADQQGRGKPMTSPIGPPVN